ncbi:MAG: holo-ACP synthase [Myxococcota bacterium]
MNVGCDLQSVAELRARPGLLDNGAVFTAYERSYCRSKQDPWPSLGGLWAAKEACLKALSAVEPAPFTFPSLEIRHRADGRPVVVAHGALGAWLAERGLGLEVSISHSQEIVMAVACLGGAA